MAERSIAVAVPEGVPQDLVAAAFNSRDACNSLAFAQTAAARAQTSVFALQQQFLFAERELVRVEARRLLPGAFIALPLPLPMSKCACACVLSSTLRASL